MTASNIGFFWRKSRVLKNVFTGVGNLHRIHFHERLKLSSSKGGSLNFVPKQGQSFILILLLVLKKRYNGNAFLASASNVTSWQPVNDFRIFIRSFEKYVISQFFVCLLVVRFHQKFQGCKVFTVVGL
ncbi:hypothetical protein D3C86_1422200 [compost metagenome]